MGQSKSRKKMQIKKKKNACIYKNYEIVKYP